MRFVTYEESIHHVNEFCETYGLRKKWVAEKAKIPIKEFSMFINGRLILPTSKYERLMDFVEEYEKRMVGFKVVDFSGERPCIKNAMKKEV